MKDSRIEALKQAMKMEEDGKNYYKQAMDRVESKLAKDVFKSLIKAEERHVRKIKELYRSLSETGQWPNVVLTRENSERSANIFAAAMSDLNEKVKGTTTDIEALKTAAKLEDDGIKYYQAKGDKADDPFEKKFYLLLAHEEGEHFISILDTIEFLEDPQGYFSQLERGTMSF
jgi:rubrerythrin